MKKFLIKLESQDWTFNNELNKIENCKMFYKSCLGSDAIVSLDNRKSLNTLINDADNSCFKHYAIIKCNNLIDKWQVMATNVKPSLIKDNSFNL